MKAVKLESIANINSGGTPSRSKKENYGGDILWAKISDIESAENGVIIDTSEKITEAGLLSIRNKIFEKGTLLFSMYGSIGKVAIAGTKMATNQAILGIVPKKENELFLQYLFFWFKSNRQKLISQGRGGTLQNLSTSLIRNTKIELPKYEDQIRITSILVKVETLIQQRQESIDLLDQFLKSTFLKMFGNYKKMSKSKLEMLGNNISYLTSGSRGWAKYYSVEGAKFLRIQNIGNGIIRTDNMVYVNPPDSAESKRTKIEEGDLLMSITADLGRTSVVPKDFGEAYINQHLALIRLNKNILPVYAAYFYNMPFGNNSIQRKNKAAVKAGLNFSDIKSLPIFIPSLELQEQFLAIVKKTEDLKSQFKASLKELENLFGSLSQRAFKGELALSALRVLVEKEQEYQNYTNDRAEADNFTKPQIIVEFPKKSIQSTITPQMQEFIKSTNALSKIIPKTPATIKLPTSFEKLSQQIEQINRMMVPFEKLPKIPESVLQAMKTFENIKSISSTLQLEKRSTWSDIKGLENRADIEFNELEGLAVIETEFSKKRGGFTFQDFEKFLRKENFKYTYKELQLFIFKQIQEKKLAQHFWSNNLENRLQQESDGKEATLYLDESIWFVFNNTKSLK